MGHRLLPYHPELYHAKKSSRPYFEGWYFKQISDKGTVSVIAGIFRGKSASEDISFIQLLMASGKSYFFSYPFDAFYADPNKFEVRIGDSFFSMEKMVLCIDQFGVHAEAKIYFGDIVPPEKSVFSPSIMGLFSYLPKMQCNHGVLSLLHRCNGEMTIDKQQFCFDDAHGYIEKDWGEAFPKRWIWMQCNGEKVSLMCSIATIPYGAVHFTGLICVLLVGTKQYRFASYNGARVVSIKRQENTLEVVLARGKYRLSIKTTSFVFGKLIAPAKTGMNRKIEESLDTVFYITLTHKGKEIYRSRLENGGIEMQMAQTSAGAKGKWR